MEVRLIGLKNIQSNCYLNSVLQCIINDEELMKTLSSHKKSNEVVKMIAEVFESGTFNAMELKKSLSEKKSFFKERGQQDAHECLVNLLDFIHEELKKPKTLHFKYSKRINAELNKQAAAEYNNFIKTFGYSFINNYYTGQFFSYISCVNCSHTHYSFNNFNDIYLDIEGIDARINLPSVSSSFSNYFRPTSIDDVNCEHCKKKSRIIKINSILRFPKRLVICLNRFSTFLKQSVYLDKTLTFNTKDGTVYYRIKSVINHIGSVNNGHYFTDVVKYVDNVPYYIRIDDESVKRVPNLQVSKSAYIIIYELIEDAYDD